MSRLAFTLSSFFRYRLRQKINMTTKVTLEKIKENADITKKTIDELKTELSTLTCTYNNMLAQQLREENARLVAAVEEAKRLLIQEEVNKGIPQISIPNRQASSASNPEPPQKPAIPQQPQKVESQTSEISTESGQKKPGKEAKPKKEKKAKEPKEVPAELPVDVGRLDLRIAKVEDVQNHPDADSLYVLKINCGEEKPRTVCSGLVKHVPIEELRDREVMLLCNLKPVKMRGITSEAMVMCASNDSGVEVLTPPKGCSPGEPVHCDGYTRQPDPVMNPKKKIFETVAPDLHTNDKLEACYKGVPLKVTDKGVICAKTLKNVPVK